MERLFGLHNLVRKFEIGGSHPNGGLEKNEKKRRLSLQLPKNGVPLHSPQLSPPQNVHILIQCVAESWPKAICISIVNRCASEIEHRRKIKRTKHKMNYNTVNCDDFSRASQHRTAHTLITKQTVLSRKWVL